MRFHQWKSGDAVLDRELGHVLDVRKSRWGTPAASVRFPSGTRTLTPPIEGHAARVLDRAVIARFVDLFYERVREDPMLGPVFAARIHAWPEHLEHLTSFWASVLLAEGSFEGNPAARHRAIAELTPAHFDRWIALFGETLKETCTPELREVVLGRAQAMRRGLSTIVFGAAAEQP